MRRKESVALMFIAVLIATALDTGCARRAEPARPDPSSRRVTPSGALVGFTGQYGAHVWLGVPYAAPPVGALRWRAPVPPASWTGTREALRVGSPCTQYSSSLSRIGNARPGEPAGSEDCLYLNIYAPRFTPEAVPTGAARLPVMLWIHGGGNTIGEGAFYKGGNLAATHRLIVITFNYRLGPFGWFRHPALRNDGTSALDQSGNFGTLDLIRALAWVRDNISAFGGDPGNVTIFGESAGGRNVFALLLSPQAHGLFHRAVVESGGLPVGTVAEAEHFVDDALPGDANSSNEMLLRLLVADGTASDRVAAKARLAQMTDADVERYLRGKTNVEILSAYTPFSDMGMIDMPQVFPDGVVLPAEEPLERFARPDGYNQVPVIMGTNRDEEKLFMMNDPAWVRRFLWIFQRLRDPQRYNVTAEYVSRMWKATGVDEPATVLRHTQGPSVFAYRFDWDEEPTLLGADLSVMLGAAHVLEIPFVFGHFDLGSRGNVIFTKANEPARLVLATQMMSYWAEFAYGGSPGRGRGGQLVEWAAWDNSSPTNPKFMVLDTAQGGGLRMSSDALTPTAVLAAVDADPRLPTQRDKCRIYRELAAWSRGFTKADYPTAGQKGCAEFPYETYPWD